MVVKPVYSLDVTDTIYREKPRAASISEFDFSVVLVRIFTPGLSRPHFYLQLMDATARHPSVTPRIHHKSISTNGLYSTVILES